MTHQEEKVLQEGRQETTNISILLNDLVFSFKYHLRRFNMSSFLIFKLPFFSPRVIFYTLKTHYKPTVYSRIEFLEYLHAIDHGNAGASWNSTSIFIITSVLASVTQFSFLC